MATFGSYNNTASPKMKWYAEYSYSRISNSEVSVTLTVNGEIINHSSSSYMGTGNNIIVTGTVAGQSKTYEIKASSATWRGDSNNPRSCTFSFTASSTAAGQSIGVSYAVTGSGYTAPATVPTQSTSFSSPALLYTASTISASASYNAVSITINRQNSSMTHTITYSRGSNTVSHTGCTTSDGYTVPASWITDNSGGYINVSCATYIGSTYIGTTSTRVWCTVPDSVVPTITGTAYTIADGKFGGALAGVSKIQWDASAAGADGSWITESYVSGGGYTVALNGTTGVLYNAGDNPFTIYAKDSRGRTCSATVTVSVTAYSRPSVTVQSTQHCLDDGTISDEGGYLSCMGTATYDAVGGQNTVTYQLWYRKVGDDAWSSAVTWTPGTATVIGDGEISPDSSYEVWYQAQDQVATAYYIDTVLHKRRIIDAYEDDTGVQSIGIGGAAKDGKTTIYNPLTCQEPAQLAGGQWVHEARGISGQRTYVKFAKITIKDTYANMGLSFDVIQRGYLYPSRLSVMFSGENNTDPGLASFEVYGWRTEFWIKKESASTWGVYAYKTGDYDSIDIVGFTKPSYPVVDVTWVDEAVYSLDGATAASISNMHIAVDRARSADLAQSANMLTGFTKKASSQTWGIQTGTFITGMEDSTGGSIAWRRDCPAAGKMSMVIDGNVYVDEGKYQLLSDGNIYGTFARRGDGSAGGYIKIDGYQICWGWLYFNIAVSTATGSAYYGIWEGSHNYARGFADVPAVTLTVESTLIKSVSLLSGNASGISKVQLFDSRSRSAQSWYVHYIASGPAG